MSDTAPLYAELANAPDGGAAFWFEAGSDAEEAATGDRRRKLRGAVWSGGARGTAVVFPGRTEYIEKYGRVVAALIERGFSVAVIDWRGQGLSERPLAEPLKGHVDDFAEYQADATAFLAHPAVAALGAPNVLICHSMGGCIGLRTLMEERIAPALTVFSAPMFGIHLPLHLKIGARILIALSRRLGFETAFAPAPGEGRPYVSFQGFEDNMLTSDPGVYDWLRRHLEAEPALGLGAPTLRWMRKAFEETASLAPAPPPEGPSLLFLGDEEEVVSPEAIRAFAGKTPDARLVELTGARHEVLLERPEIVERVWAEIDAALSAAGV